MSVRGSQPLSKCYKRGSGQVENFPQILKASILFLKWVRILTEIDWYYYYQGATPAPICIVQHRKLINSPAKCSVTSELSFWGGGHKNDMYYMKISVSLSFLLQ